MRNQQRIWATIFVLILAHSAEAQSRGQREALEHGWLSNYRAAKDEAKRSGRPIMLVFRCVP